jgi:F0F1-type ATP synthase membrane subunit b/b'
MSALLFIIGVSAAMVIFLMFVISFVVTITDMSNERRNKGDKDGD